MDTWAWGQYNTQTGELIRKEKIKTPMASLKKAITEAREGNFKPDKENDELTKALGNPEHTGRTRGYGPSVPWKDGFPVEEGDEEGYRSRARAKRRKEQEDASPWIISWRRQTVIYM